MWAKWTLWLTFVGAGVAACASEEPVSGLDASGLELGPAEGDLGASADAGTPDALEGADLVGPLSPLGALPPSTAVQSGRFASEESCATCHATDTTALRDAAGRDVAPVGLWRASMMAFAARDPFYLAVFAHELAEFPAARDAIEATCTRCHAPSASVELGVSGAHLSYEALVSSSADVARMGREGVTCTVCHQIRPENLGTEASYTGGFEIEESREIFGPHPAPFANPMVMQSGYTPVEGAHVRSSALCATCHTVITRALGDDGRPVGPEFPEQVPYLEWRNSSFNDELASPGPFAASCQDCHVPTVDEDGVTISTPISSRPRTLAARSPVGKHVFVGANSYMLRLIADNVEWVGADATAEEILERAELTAASLSRAADLSIEGLELADGVLRAQVQIRNQSGHKLPTAYPSRRVWLRFEVLDPDDVVLFVSGATDARGNLVDGRGARLDQTGVLLPHRDLIRSDAEVQVYQSVMQDAEGRVTSALLRATAYAKDNRLLPLGWSPEHPDAALTQAVGVEADENFGPGLDRVSYQIAAPPGAARVRVSLYYQSIPPVAVEGLSDHNSPALLRFSAMTEARPPTPELLAQVEAVLP